MLKKLDATLSGMLDNGYLFNEKQKRDRSDIVFLLVTLLIIDLVDGIASALYFRRTEVLISVTALPLFVLGMLLIVGRIRKAENARLLAALCLIMNIWLQFILGAEFINYTTMLLYPIAVCYFLGNSYALKYLPLMFVNILICMGAWGSVIEESGNSDIYPQIFAGFICSCLLGFSIGYIHERSFSALVMFADKVSTNAHIDPLTRMLTRRAFGERFAQQLEEQALMGKPLFIIMCDIDHFKKVNDTYGHQMGDDVLKHVSGILSKYAVGRDVCFRWGGEEFLMFLHERSMQKAIDATQRIRVVLEHTPFLSVTAGVIRVTMSFGLHQYDPCLSMEKNISVADGYMYAAKHNGRNMVLYNEN